MSGTGDVNYRHLQELARPADSILSLGLVALGHETTERRKQRWQELEANWQAYEAQLLGRLKPAADQDFRSTIALARLLLALSLQEQGQTLSGITDFFSAKEVYLGRLLAGSEALEAFTPEELVKEAQRSPDLRQLLADMAEHHQKSIAELLEPPSIRKDLVAAFKSKWDTRLRRLEEVARLYQAEKIEREIEEKGAGPVLQPAETPQTQETLQTQRTQSTINITGPVDGPIIIKQELKAEPKAPKGHGGAGEGEKGQDKPKRSIFRRLFWR